MSWAHKRKSKEISKYKKKPKMLLSIKMRNSEKLQSLEKFENYVDNCTAKHKKRCRKPDRKARHAIKSRHALFPSHRAHRAPTLLKRYSGRIKHSELLHNFQGRLQRVSLHQHRGILKDVS